MFKRNKKQPLNGFAPTSTSTSTSSSQSGDSSNAGNPKSATSPNSSNSDTAATFLASLNNPEVVERVRTTIRNSHVFKLPTRQTGSIGWRGADWKEKVWHGTVKVVDRNNITAVLLIGNDGDKYTSTTSSDKNEDGNGNKGRPKGTIFAVCPIVEGVNAVERCVDSSRYFVLRIENQGGRHMFIGLAFNERNDAFDFNTALQDAKKERDFAIHAASGADGNGSGNGAQDSDGFGHGQSNLNSSRDYSLKEGEKITVHIPKTPFSSLGTNSENGTLAFANFQAEFDENEYSPDKQSSAADSSSGSAYLNRKDKIKTRLSTPGSSSGGFMLRPSKKDTPARTAM
jgi:hypothetical protein